MWGLEPTNWSKVSKDWNHLKDVEFLYPSKGIVDMLIGVDYAEFHVALEERVGRPGEPVPRKTPLGWTYVGPTTKCSRYSSYHVKQVNTFKCTTKEETKVDQLLQRFWEIENTGIVKDQSFQTEEEVHAMKVVKESMKPIEGGKYEVIIS